MRQALFLFEWKPIDRHYLPGRALAYSVVVHGLILCGLSYISLHGNAAKRPRGEEPIAYINLKDPYDVLYLPTLVDDDPVRVPHSEPVRTKLPKPEGLSYPGRQFIHSDFPEPTNNVLTVLQPSVVNPPILSSPLLLPNLVQMAAVPPPPPPPPPPAPVKLMDPSLMAQIQVASNPDPKLAKVLDLPIKLVPPPAPKVEAPPPPIPNPEPAAKPVDPILILTPMPAPHQETLSIPVGEAHGRFSISPDANPAAAGNTASNVLKDKAPAANSDDGIRGTRGVAAPPAATTGTTSSTGRGNSNPFPGITILGGPSDTGNNRNSTNIISIGTAPPPLQTSYGITIVSTEGSGGGLPQYGVFTNEQIFSVYLDMRRTVSDPAPSWTFEYAILKGTNTPPTPPASPSRSQQQGLVLPFPTLKEQPVLPPDLVRKYQRLRLIVYAVINTDGKMEQVTVNESPDPLLNAPVLIALSKWAFRPAQLDGEKVSVKVLIGIPLS